MSYTFLKTLTLGVALLTFNVVAQDTVQEKPKASGGCKVTMPIIQLINDTKDTVTTLNCGYGQFHDATLDPSKITQSTDYSLEIQTGNNKKEKSVYSFVDGNNGQPKDGVFQTEEWVRKLKGTRSSTQKNSPLIWTEFVNTGGAIHKYPVTYKDGVTKLKPNTTTTIIKDKVVNPFNL